MKSMLNVLLIAMIVAALPAMAAENTNDVQYIVDPITLPSLVAAPAGSAVEQCIQLAFVIDNTGSMAGAINNIKTNLVNILNTAIVESGGNLQASVVTFYDDVHVLQPMTSNMTDVTNAINSMVATGGVGWPEASDEALKELYSASACLAFGDFNPGDWNTECCRLAVLVTDAPPAGCDDLYTNGVDNIAAQNIAWGIKVGAVLVGGPDADALPVMQNYAAQTDGIYANVPSDGTGISDAIEIMVRSCNDATLTELCCLTAGCATVLQGECLELGGVIVPSCDVCDPIPAEQRSWGELKSMYK